MREAKAGRAVMRISPAQLSESKCPSLADSFRLNGFAQRGSGDERVGGHKSVQLAPRGRRRDGHGATYRSAFVRPPFPNLFRRAARLLRPRRRFPLYSWTGRGRTLPNYYSQLWQKWSTRSFHPCSFKYSSECIFLAVLER